MSEKERIVDIDYKSYYHKHLEEIECLKMKLMDSEERNRMLREEIARLSGIKATVETPATPKRGDHTIELVNVSFKYPDSDVYVLRNVSFKNNLLCRSGEGCGKGNAGTLTGIPGRGESVR